MHNKNRRTPLPSVSYCSFPFPKLMKIQNKTHNLGTKIKNKEIFKSICKAIPMPQTIFVNRKILLCQTTSDILPYKVRHNLNNKASRLNNVRHNFSPQGMKKSNRPNIVHNKSNLPNKTTEKTFSYPMENSNFSHLFSL